jgi:hypothetical protein
MKLKLLIVTALLSAASAVPGTAGASPSAYSPYLVSAQILVKVVNVSRCEEGGNWQYPLKTAWAAHKGDVYVLTHSKYFGGLGWLQATWNQFRAPDFPAVMNKANPEQQAWAMAHFVGSVFHGWWPDQGRCTGPY